MSSFDPEFIRHLMTDDEHGLLDVRPAAAPVTPEDRLKASFDEIVEFVRTHGREPERNPKDIHETKLAMRLKAIAGNEAQYEALREFDELRILAPPAPPENVEEALQDDPFGLLAEPGSGVATTDIFTLRNVPESARDVSPADEVAERTKCEDFDQFEHLFKEIHQDLRSGRRHTIKFRGTRHLDKGKFFVYGGIVCYIAEVGELVRDERGRVNGRLRVIFENGTESNLLHQSLQTGLRKNDGKRISEPDDELLGRERIAVADGTRMGSVYVLRSLSSDPKLAPYSHLHKIGHTTQSVEARTAQAVKDATFLSAAVEVRAEYELPAVAAQKVEAMLHRFFAGARLDIWFERDGYSVADANEWFDVPLPVIDEAIQLIQAETIGQFEYDAHERRIRLSTRMG